MTPRCRAGGCERHSVGCVLDAATGEMLRLCLPHTMFFINARIDIQQIIKDPRTLLA